jgi:lipopolysaccharide export system permease protein
LRKILQRYLAAHFIPPFLLATTFFASFLLTFQLFRLISIVINKGMSFLLVLELMGHIAISFFPMSVPLSAMFASIFTMNKLSEDSELIAMRSFGLTKGRLFTPFLILGLMIALATFALNLKLIPYSRLVFRNTLIKLTSEGAMTDLRPGHFFTDIPDITIFAEDVSADGTRLTDIFIRSSKQGEEQVIFARNGAIIKQVLDEVSTPTLRMHLNDGNILKVRSGNQDVEKILFQEYDFPIVTGGGIPGFVSKDSMKTSSELWREMERLKTHARELEKKENKNELNQANADIKRMALEYWGRINTPLQVLVFIFLGFSLGIKKGRGHAKNSGAVALAVLIGYYALYFIGVSLVKKLDIPVWILIFMPTVLATMLGIRFYRRLDWAG